MEKYTFNLNDTMFILEISEDIVDRFNGEGIHQKVILYSFNVNNKRKRIIYETTYGRLHALSFFKKINIIDLVEYENTLEDIQDNFIIFKDWIVEYLTPIEIKRGEKIEKIKSNF